MVVCNVTSILRRLQQRQRMRCGKVQGGEVKLTRARELKSACELRNSGNRQRFELKGPWRPDKAMDQTQQ